MPDRNVLLSEIMERIDQLREMEVLPTVPSIAPGTPCEVWDNHEARRMLAYFGRWECGKAMCSVEKNSGHYDPFDNAVPIVGNRGVDWSGVPRSIEYIVREKGEPALWFEDIPATWLGVYPNFEVLYRRPKV